MRKIWEFCWLLSIKNRQTILNPIEQSRISTRSTFKIVLKELNVQESNVKQTASWVDFKKTFCRSLPLEVIAISYNPQTSVIWILLFAADAVAWVFSQRQPPS